MDNSTPKGVFVTKILSKGMVMCRRKAGTLMEDPEAEGRAFRGSVQWRPIYRHKHILLVLKQVIWGRATYLVVEPHFSRYLLA